MTDKLAEENVDSPGEALAKMRGNRLVEKLADQLPEADIETLRTHGLTLRPRCWSTLWLNG